MVVMCQSCDNQDQNKWCIVENILEQFIIHLSGESLSDGTAVMTTVFKITIIRTI